MAATRLIAPVEAPPPPKPPQLSLVASAVMPDVATDAFGPGVGPLLADAGWEVRRYGRDAGRDAKDEWGWERPPGDEWMRRATEHRNALVASIGATGELAMQQTAEGAPVDPTSLPTSIFGATTKSRWTGGFAYAPENQAAAGLADPCGAELDIPSVAVPVANAVASTAAGTLAAGTYHYFVTAVTANGEGLPSADASAVLGATGEITLTWALTSTLIASFNVYRGTTSSSSAAVILGSVTAPAYNEDAPLTVTFVDNGSLTPGATHPPTTDGTGGPGYYLNLPQVAFIPFLVQAEDSCSAFGWEARDFVGRALRLLDNATPAAVEREFWLGNFAQTIYSSLPADVQAIGANAFLTQSGTPSSGGSALVPQDLTPASPPSITRGIQILEDYLANTGFGGQGMLHLAPETSPNLLGARRVGALLLSVMDNIIVPGSGYPTSGATGPAGNANANPGAGFAWIFATDLVSVRLDEPFVTPTSWAEALDRGAGGEPNKIRIRAQRFGAATFDGARLAACRVALTT